MKNHSFLLTLLGAMVALMCSCSSRNQELMRTVPKDTQCLMLADVARLSPKLQEKPSLISDGIIALSGRFLPSSNSAEMKKIWDFVFSEGSGADFSFPLAFFEHHNALIATLGLDDAEEFRKGIESATGSRFIEYKGVRSLPDNTVFTCGSQAWIAAPYPKVSADDILGFVALTPEASVLSVDLASSLGAGTADVAGFINLKAVMPYENPALMLGLNSVLEDLKYFAFNVDFNDGEAVGNIRLLNSGCTPAVSALPFLKIDVPKLEAFPGKGNLFVATALDPSVMKPLLSGFGSMAPIPAELREALSAIDGNLVFSAFTGNEGAPVSSVSLMVSFADRTSAEKCRKSIEESGLADGLVPGVDGNSLLLISPSREGDGIREVASSFSDAGLGIVFLTAPLGPDSAPEVKDLLSKVVVRGLQDGRGLKFDFSVATKKGSNSLFSLLQLSSFLKK